MRTHTHTLRSASTAIAAVLALGSTPLLAQAISPTGDPVILAPAPAAPPTVVQAPPPVTTTAPVVQSLPDTYVPAKAAAPAVSPSAAPATTAATRTAAPAKTPAVRAAAAPAAAAPASVSAANDTAPAAASVEASPPSDGQLFPPSETAQDSRKVVTTPKPAGDAVDDFTVVTGVVGGLALLAFGWFGVTLARRRKTRKAVAVPPQITRPVVRPQPQSLAAAVAAPQALPETAVSEPTPVMADPQAIPASSATPRPIRQDMNDIPAVARAENAFGAGNPRWAEDARPRSTQSSVKGALPSNGAAVDLPAKRPDNYEEREELFKRMVEAKPDKANPFTDRRSRMKRARLIVASLDQDFADRDPWIDLSQYPNNWPELAKRRFPQAA